ncbi:MAG: hypothetical protein R8K49_02075 [Mariprofundaceae bacterium]
MEHVTDGLYWNSLNVCDQTLEANHVGTTEHVRIVMNNQMQYSFLGYFFPQFQLNEAGDPPVFLQHKGERFAAGSAEFCAHVACMIRHRGLLANLTMRENLLLPFLYAENSERLKQAESELEEVADFLELSSLLDEQAGERSVFTHALVSLGHCLLKKPNIIIAQEVHVGMPPERQELFRKKAMQAMQKLQAGVLYLTSSTEEGSGLEFSRTYEIECANVSDMSGIW